MPYFTIRADADDFEPCSQPGDTVRAVASEDVTVSIDNDARANGYEEENPGACDWFNGASIRVNTEHDEVNFFLSVADPRGGFSVTFRRTDDGRILLHLPQPGETCAHVETTELHPGTLELAGNYATEAPEDDED